MSMDIASNTVSLPASRPWRTALVLAAMVTILTAITIANHCL